MLLLLSTSLLTLPLCFPNSLIYRQRLWLYSCPNSVKQPNKMSSGEKINSDRKFSLGVIGEGVLESFTLLSVVIIVEKYLLNSSATSPGHKVENSAVESDPM